MKRILLAIMLIAGTTLGAVAQPQWVYKTPTPKRNCGYLYEVTVGTGSTENEARTQAIARVYEQTGRRLEQPVDLAEINRAVRRGDNFAVLSSTLNIKIKDVDFFAERLKDGTWRYHLLCQVAESANKEPKFNNYHDPDDAIALMESAFIPGLGQMLREHKPAGAMILTGEIALVGAGTFCYLTAQNKLDVMHSDGVNYADYSKARDDYNRLRDASFVIWGTAAGLYVFNLFSAYYMKRPKIKYALYPTVLPENERVAPGLAVRVEF